MLFGNIADGPQGVNDPEDHGRRRQRLSDAPGLHHRLVRLGPRCAARQHGAGADRAGRHRQRPADRQDRARGVLSRARAAAALEAFKLSYEAATLEQPRARLTVRERADDEPHELPLNQWSFVDAPLDQAARRHQAQAGLSLRVPLRGQEPQGARAGLRRHPRCRELAALRSGGDQGHRPAGSAMRWPSASPRPAAICATTSPRASIATKQGRKVFDGIHSHIAGIGRIFFNTPFGQPARTGTQHEDHGFPENEFPFSTATLADPLTGKKGSLFRGDGSDPKLIETNTSTEYWQKGASLLHTDPLGTAGRGAARELARLHDRRHPAWRPRRRHDRSRPQHQSAQPAQSDARRARAAGGARRMGGVGQGAAAQPRADAGRRHPGRARQDGLPRRAGRRRGARSPTRWPRPATG